MSQVYFKYFWKKVNEGCVFIFNRKWLRGKGNRSQPESFFILDFPSFNVKSGRHDEQLLCSLIQLKQFGTTLAEHAKHAWLLALCEKFWLHSEQTLGKAQYLQLAILQSIQMLFRSSLKPILHAVQTLLELQSEQKGFEGGEQVDCTPKVSRKKSIILSIVAFLKIVISEIMIKIYISQ